jgi:YbbR domain-containing protein
MKVIRRFIKNLPSLFAALVFALAVWIFAVTQADPTETRNYPRSLEMDVIGLNPELMIVNDITRQVNLIIRAPTTILNQLENDSTLINITLDLTGLEEGVHTLTPQVNIDLAPAQIAGINPGSIFLKLESVVTGSFPLQVRTIGNPAIGFELQDPELNVENVIVSGPKSLVEAVENVIAHVDVENVSEDIQRTVTPIPLDSDGNEIDGLLVSPGTLQVTIPVTQRGGYRTVVVKIVTSGQIAPGYKLTNIFTLPPTVTIFSSDPELVESIPGFVETTPINLNGASENLEIRVALNLPEGINVVGSQNVTVQIGIDPIESSISFTNIPVQVQELGQGLQAEVSPENVDVYLSGPLDLLDQLDRSMITVIIDLSGRGVGTYQLAPEVLLENENIDVDAILPSTIEVIISQSN